MDGNNVIEVKDVTMRFNMSKERVDSLKEYIIKGFVLNTERLKNPGGWDYFDELLEKIREIRASEKRFYVEARRLF